MIEIITEAIVLDKEDLGEQDSRVFLYTKDLGKVSAKATSARKIISKLAGHLEPLNYLTARLVSKRDLLSGRRGFQLADALLIDNAGELKRAPELLARTIKAADLICRSVPEEVPDKELWDFLLAVIILRKKTDAAGALAILGFNPSFAHCELCDFNKPQYFFPKNNFFVCGTCRASSQEPRKEFIEI